MVRRVSRPIAGLRRLLGQATQSAHTPLWPPKLDGPVVGIALLFGVAFFLLAWGEIGFTRGAGRIASVWLANAVAVAVLLRQPARTRLLLAIAGFAGNVAANLAVGDSLFGALWLSSCNTVEIAVVVTAMARSFHPGDRFESGMLGRFLLVAAAAPLLSSVAAAAYLAWPSRLDMVAAKTLLAAGESWYVPDTLGLLILVPILLATERAADRGARAGGLEHVFLPSLAVALAILGFAQGNLPVLFLMTPILLVAAIRLPLRSAMLTVAAVATIAIMFSAAGIGPIANAPLALAGRSHALQAFIATMVLLVLPVRAIISERDRFNAARRDSDQRCQRIAEISAAGLLLLGRNGEVDFANARWIELAGQAPQSLADDGWLECFEPVDRPVARALWERARTLHTVTSEDLRYRTATTSGWAELQFQPEAADGRVLGFVARLVDVTRHRAAEDALQTSRGLYRLLAENTHDVIARLGVDGRILYASTAARRLFGFDSSDLVGLPLADFIHPDDLAGFETLLLAIGSGRGEGTVQLRHRRLNDDWLWVEANAQATIDLVSGEPIELIVSIRDIDARRRSEMIAASAAARLGETNRLLTLAEGVAQVGHWRFDIAAQSLDCSPQVKTITGLSSNKPFGPAAILARVHPADRRALLRTLLTASRRREPAQHGARLVLANELRHIRLLALAEYDDADTLTGLFGVIQDVTEDEFIQAELIRARNEAQAAANAKSDFLSTMSHEIRTPMTGVLGMIDLLRENPPVAERERFLLTLKQSADMLMTVLDDVLDFSRIESGRVEFEDGDFEIEELMQSTIALFNGAASQKGLLLELEINRCTSTKVRGDAVRLQQVVSNLLSNAIKFTAHGHVTLLLAASPAEDDVHPGAHGPAAHGPAAQRWRIEVRDTGIGIAADKIGLLFEPFVQAEAATSRRFGGTGLGLAISRRLIDAMGGQSGVHSRPGSGSTFWFEVTLPEGSGAEAAAFPTEPAAGLRPLDLLVAEDNSVNQMIISAILRRLGHRVTCVDNGRLALNCASAHPFDAILMDMQMPEMDGLAATRAIRNLPPPCNAVPIIALTADASSERRRFYDGAGLTHFLTKPIDRLALAARLDEIAMGRAQPLALPPEPPTLSSADPVGQLLDVARYHELRDVLGGVRVHALLDLLVAEIDLCPARIRQCIERGDLDAARAEAHSLRGAASNLGATALGNVAAALECACSAGRPELDALDDQARRTVKAIAALR